MGHVHNSDRLANSYTASRRTWKWTKKLFFHLLDLAIVTVTSFYLHVVGRKFHTEISVSPLSERCWHGLGMSHGHPCLWEDQPQLLLTSEDWTHVTISTGLAANISSGVVACVQRGARREPCHSNVSSVTWRFVWTEVVLKITTQKKNDL